MQIRQFEDKNLSHYSYAILSNCTKQVVIIDPSRNVQQYLNYAQQHEATIIGIIETHPHADFVSGHLELHQVTGAPIYVSKLVHALYPHKPFDEGDSITFGNIELDALNTPGHSPDSICVLLQHKGETKAVFTGDTLFIGDCGRPDLREDAGQVKVTRNELARQMYTSLREKLLPLPNEVEVYPAHGAGTLCGKNLSADSSSTMGKEKQTNWSLQQATIEEFVENLLADQPFVPQYFAYNVQLNREGAPKLQPNIEGVEIATAKGTYPNEQLWVVDCRNEEAFKAGHLPHSINLMEKGKFETWLGSIIAPGEKFYLAGDSREQLLSVIERAASIGYETAIVKALIVSHAAVHEPEIDLQLFKRNIPEYTIVDVRNEAEVIDEPIFENSISMPLAEVRERVKEIPTDKPIVVHCAGGYRSAAASSIIQASLKKVNVFDLGDAIKGFQEKSSGKN